MSTDAVVDLTAIERNAGDLVQYVGAHPSSEVMTVVADDGYGHGMLAVARAALAGGATWLGVPTLEEALVLRAAGIESRILAWAWEPREIDLLADAVSAEVDLSAADVDQIEAVRRAANRVPDALPRLHLEVSTSSDAAAGSSGLFEVAAGLQRLAEAQVVGIWSRMVAANEPGHAIHDVQMTRYQEALNTATLMGIVPSVRHLADSLAIFNLHGTHMDLVRAGTASYGITAVPEAAAIGLVPAMTVRTRVTRIYDDPDAGTTVAEVPIGSADGLPSQIFGELAPTVGGRRFPIRGPIEARRLHLDIGDAAVVAGDGVTVLGPGSEGEPTAMEWATATHTPVRTIVVELGSHLERRYVKP